MVKQEDGCLIVFEGIDGSGKTTLARNLYEYLSSPEYLKDQVVLTKEPGATELGKELRSLVMQNKYNSYTEFLLFAADRSEHFAEIIFPALKENKIIISDRLSDSSLAYQGYGKGIDKDFIIYTNKFTMNNYIPDIVFYVDIDYSTAQQRIKSRSAKNNNNQENSNKFDREKESFFTRVQKGFKEIYKNNPRVCLLDGTQDIATLNKEVINYLQNVLSLKKFGKKA